MNIWIKRSLSTVAITGGIVFAGAAAANAADDGHDITSQHSESSSSSKGPASAPIELGGLDIGTSSESSTSSSSSSSSSDGDRSVEQSSSSEDSSSNESGLSTGGISLDPQAAFSQEKQSESSNVDAGSTDSRNSSSSSTSESEASASAPIHVGGIELTTQSQKDSADESSSKAQDGDRGVSESSESSSSSNNGSSVGVGALDIDPQALLGQKSATSSERLGDEDGIRESASSSESTGEAALPVSFGGISIGTESESEKAQRDTDAVVDGDRSSARDVQSSSKDSSAASLEGLGFGFAPAFGFVQESAQESSSLGGSDGIRDTASSSASSATGEAPFHFDGLAGSLVQTSEAAGRSEQVAVDGDRSVRDVTEQSSSAADGFAARGGAFEGHPSFGLEQTSQDATSRVGDLVRTETSSTSKGEYAFPFTSEGISALFDSIREDNRASLNEVRDGDRTSSETSSDATSDRQRSSFGFEGVSGDPAGSFEQSVHEVTQNLLR